MNDLDWNRIAKILVRMKPELARRFIASLAPAHVALNLASGGTGLVSWQPRTVAGLAWVDGAGDPDLAGRRFAVVVTRGSASWTGEAMATTSVTIDAAGMTALGHGVASISISEIGALGTSRAAVASAII